LDAAARRRGAAGLIERSIDWAVPGERPCAYDMGMPQVLPRLRFELDFQPSPIADRPGLMVRDPYGYSDATLIVPTQLVPALSCFDGRQTELDLRQALAAATSDAQVDELMNHLISTLDTAGFLNTPGFDALRERSHQRFAQTPRRAAAHAGGAYPDDPAELRELFLDYLAQPEHPPAAAAGLVGIAAPHVSPEGGWKCYREAFGALPEELKDDLFVVLGTSHYGEPGRFGLTRKDYVTPYGAARTETSWVDELARNAASGVCMEDYCHAVEHSIEFQVVFLQTLYGANVRVLPVLCGSFGHCIAEGKRPEQDEGIRAFLDSLAGLTAREGAHVRFVLGVDLAHIGRRYGDASAARCGEGRMTEVERRDHERLAALGAGDADGFWDLVAGKREDELRWCGSAPLYTFLRAARPARAELRRYQQWNIDEQSAVTFAALSFHRAPRGTE
jgi:hypothetical protein